MAKNKSESTKSPAPAPAPAPAPPPKAKAKAKAEKPTTPAAPPAAPAAKVEKADKIKKSDKSKKPAKSTPASDKPIPKSIGKNDLYKKLTDSVNTSLEEKDAKVTKKHVGLFFDKLVEIIKAELSKDGPGVLKLPNLLKLSRDEKPATPEREKPSPFDSTKKMIVKAKPARTEVKVRPLKDLKTLLDSAK